MTISLKSMRRIEDICSSFERTGKLGGEVVNSLLDQIEPTEQTILATELIPLDAELRLRAGQSPSAADYQKVWERPSVHLTEPQLHQLVEHATRPDAQSANSPPESSRYRFLQRIGRGAYGDVWRVDDAVGRRTLAVKVLRKSLLDDPNAGARLLREALLTGRLQHPGIPPIYDHGTFDDGAAFYSMKLVGGTTLESILNERTSEDDELQRSLTIFHSVVQTVAYAHASGIIHRDLKPHNIMVGDFGEVQVMDWGLAKSIDDRKEEPADEICDPVHGDTSTSLTTDGDLLGTPAYMSPEQARGEQQTLAARSDIFSLGAILYRILTNRRLHQDNSPRDAIRRTAAGDFTGALAQLNSTDAHCNLIELCRRCLAVSADDRPDARQVSRAINEYFASVQQRAQQADFQRREVVVRQAEMNRRRHLQLLAACIIASVCVVGAAVAYWQRGQAVAAQRQAAQANAIAIRETETATEINGFLIDLLASARPEEKGVQVTVREILDAMLPRIGDRFQDKPQVEGTIRRTFGTTYRSLGMNDIALQQHRLSVAAFERVVPIDEEALLISQDRLAGILRSRGSPTELAEALRLRQHVLRRTTELFGDTAQRTILAMNNLALVYAKQQDYVKAQDLMQRSIELEEANGNVDPLLLDFSRFNLATFALDSKDYKTAEEEDIALSAFKSFCLGAQDGKFGPIDGRDEFWKLLYCIASRKAGVSLRYLQAIKRGGGQVTDESAPGRIEQVAEGYASPVSIEAFLKDCEDLFELLDTDELRIIAIMRVEGYSVDEIAERIGCAKRSVERRLNLIRQIWKSALDYDSTSPRTSVR